MSEKADESPERKKARIFLNEAKNRQTSHWDVDVLPQAEVEALYRAGRRRQWQQKMATLGLALAVIAIAAVITALVLRSI